MWSIEWSAKSRNQFKKIDKAEQQKIISSLDECAHDPFKFIKKLKGLPLNSLRVGNYRIILQLVQNKMLIYVVKVGHRSTVYDL